MSATAISALAGLGGALIGAFAALGGTWWQARAAAKAADVDARERAYVDLLVGSQAFSLRVAALIDTLEFRSGLGEGLAVTLGQRAPLDSMAVQDWMDVDLRPLLNAWSRGWTCASPRGVELSNTLLAACVDLASVLSDGADLSRLGKIRTALLGARVDRHRALYEERLPALTAARKDLADLVRAETGRPPALLIPGTADDHPPKD